jgi:hypothetical protein
VLAGKEAHLDPQCTQLEKGHRGYDKVPTAIAGVRHAL